MQAYRHINNALAWRSCFRIAWIAPNPDAEWLHQYTENLWAERNREEN